MSRREYNIMRKVSIILPTYNTGQYIFNMLDSIKEQTYSSIQLVIIDDNSTDKTYDYIKKWIKEKQDREGLEVLLYRNEKNRGLTDTINRGYKYCNGDYIFLADHDDIWLPNKVNKQVNLLEENEDTILCFHDRQIINSNDKVICVSEYNYLKYIKTTASYEDILNKRVRYSANTLCFKNTTEVKSIFPIPSNMIEHDYFILISLSFLGKVRYIHETLIQYRVHENNISGNYSIETTNSYKRYREAVNRNMKRNKEIETNDPLIVKDFIKKEFQRIIEIPSENEDETLMKRIWDKCPYFHYIYVRLIVRRRFIR